MRFPVFMSLLAFAIVPVAAQDVPESFKRCQACHAIGEGAEHKGGPQLNGIVDEPAGSRPGYSYSRAMQTAAAGGLEWNRQALTLYLKQPKHFLPGTSMAFAGFLHRAGIDEVIDYLAGFDANGMPVSP